MTESVADDELAAFIDRILRMKSEEDAIKADIKEIYAEAKGRGYDKTRLGETVATVRKLEKDADGEAEKQAIRDLYLTAYFRAKNKPHTHAYARGDYGTTRNASNSGLDSDKSGAGGTTPDHDAETGEIIEPQSAPQAAQDGGAFSEVKGSARLENAVGVEPSPSNPIQPETAVTSAEPVKASASDGGQGDVPVSPSNLTTFVQKPLRPYCQNPGTTCGGMGRKHCFKCEQARNEAGAA